MFKNNIAISRKKVYLFFRLLEENVLISEAFRDSPNLLITLRHRDTTYRFIYLAKRTSKYLVRLLNTDNDIVGMLWDTNREHSGVVDGIASVKILQDTLTLLNAFSRDHDIVLEIEPNTIPYNLGAELSPRQLIVKELLAQGLSVGEISRILGVPRKKISKAIEKIGSKGFTV